MERYTRLAALLAFCCAGIAWTGWALEMTGPYATPGAVGSTEITDGSVAAVDLAADPDSLAKVSNGTMSVTGSSVTVAPGIGLELSGSGGYLTSRSSVTANSFFGRTAHLGAAPNVSTFSATGSLVMAENAGITLSGPSGNITTGSSVTAGAFFGDASNMRFGGAVSIKKNTQGKTNDTTLADDLDLAAPLLANSTYTFEGVLLSSASNQQPDIKIAFSVPAGASLAWSFIAGADTSSTQVNGAVRGSGTSSGEIPLNTFTANVFFRGHVVTGSTAGNIALQWAQFSPGTGQTTFAQVDSYVAVTRR